MIFSLMPTMMKRLLTVFFFFLILTSAGSSQAVAANNRGIQFQDEIKLGGDVLALHGIGLLKWRYLVNVYLVGLYKPEQVPVTRVLEDIPKRLEYFFFVDMKARDFQDTGFRLMANNVGEEKALGFKSQLEALNRLYRDVKAGQRYTLTYLPGKGVEMALDGKVLGQVEGAEFAAAYFSIWLGPKPVNKSLQKGLFDSSTRFQ